MCCTCFFRYVWTRISGADNLAYMSIFLFAIYTWDFFSDIFFSLEVFDRAGEVSQEKAVRYYVLLGLCVLFIVLPMVLNLRNLLLFQTKWQSDPLHADRYRAWLDTFVCFSTFSAQNL